MTLEVLSHETSEGGLAHSAISSITKVLELMNLGSESGSLLMDKLPQELLIEIFQFAVAAHGGRANAVTPLFLGKICRSWRAMVFETCTFWQEVTLIINPHCSTQISLLADWTARAGSLPLSVSIIDPKGRLTAQEVLTRFLGLLRSLSPQTHSLALGTLIPFYDEWQNCGLADYSWPLLSNLSLATIKGGTELSDPASKLDFSSCPMLTTSTINSFDHSYISLPWRSLLHLHLNSVFSSEIYTALQSCPSLETMEAHGIIENNAFVGDATSLRRPLKSLSLKLERFQFDSEQCYRIFNSLRIPELRTLEIKLAFSRSPHDSHRFDIYPCISQSQCQLSELSIQGASLKEQLFLDCLSLLPSLSTLRLSNIFWLPEPPQLFQPTLFKPSSLVFILGTGPSQPPILPNLKALIFEESLVAFSAKFLVELLVSRWDDCGSGVEYLATLRSVRFAPLELGGMWNISEDDKAAFERWRQRGYDIRVEGWKLYSR
ncbi:hypothetical protein D9611_005901 [Ephemerocybe angulata]|uniref:F-box domain-containing protein n=1 Tax=Ephemerocybe angulata TaxID=980116 RepID=A0A8H5CG93_9AGAR|nr:hypothetical protein D9611_005901 [Tulosesus angulatus]